MTKGMPVMPSYCHKLRQRARHVHDRQQGFSHFPKIWRARLGVQSGDMNRADIPTKRRVLIAPTYPQNMDIAALWTHFYKH